ncbi:MAG: restriction endonuclease [Desulfuromonadales bacterium]|nr:restriction endonuclease [Desulfuromonadales bacterium]
MNRKVRIQRLLAAIPDLSDYRLELIDRVVSVFLQPWEIYRAPDSDIISYGSLLDFGDVLRLHHSFSREPFSKDKFEFALEMVLMTSGCAALLAPRGTRGHDLSIAGQKFSLKTEAAKGIRLSTLHISKFMELGGGHWGDNLDDLIGLRQQFLDNLAGINRILVLRALRKGSPDYLYELVEIPKNILEMAKDGRFEMRMESRQYPKPGYCYVEENGQALFSLYFDGGGERKLQIKGLMKASCIVHATWRFEEPQQQVPA